MRCIPRWIHFRSTLSVLLSPQYSETESVAAKSPSSANSYAEQQHREEWTVGQRGDSQYGFPWDKILGAFATLSPIALHCGGGKSSQLAHHQLVLSQCRNEKLSKGE